MLDWPAHMQETTERVTRLFADRGTRAYAVDLLDSLDRDGVHTGLAVMVPESMQEALARFRSKKESKA